MYIERILGRGWMAGAAREKQDGGLDLFVRLFWRALYGNVRVLFYGFRQYKEMCKGE